MLQCVSRSVSSSAVSSQVSTLVADTGLVHYGIDLHMDVRQGPCSILRTWTSACLRDVTWMCLGARCCALSPSDEST